MTSPVENITVRCPECDHVYEDWWRPSMNLGVDDFDEQYITEATSSTCPQCGYRIQHESLVVSEDGVFQLGPAINPIAAKLIAKGSAILDAKPSFVEFTHDRGADELVNDLAEHPHAYLIACIMDRQIKAERAWRIPYELRQRLGTFEFADLHRLAEEDIATAMSHPAPLHRFNNDMAHYIRLALDRIDRDYGGNAGAIWADEPSSATVIYRFLEFEGVGQKIATMAANILARRFKVPMRDYYSIDVSVDVQVRRVMTRLGLTEAGASADKIVYRARSLSPEFPGIIDSSLWEIGRNWCRPKQPQCAKCFMRAVCPSACGDGRGPG